MSRVIASYMYKKLYFRSLSSAYSKTRTAYNGISLAWQDQTIPKIKQNTTCTMLCQQQHPPNMPQQSSTAFHICHARHSRVSQWVWLMLASRRFRNSLPKLGSIRIELRYNLDAPNSKRCDAWGWREIVKSWGFVFGRAFRLIDRTTQK